jgi:hypothetical protein
MPTARPIIQRAIEAAGTDAPLVMQLIRRILEDVYGGTWGVLIVKNTELVSTAVHWTIPDHKHDDGSPAFCLTVEVFSLSFYVYSRSRLGCLAV